MKNKEIFKLLEKMKTLARPDEDFVIKSRWRMERMVRESQPEERVVFRPVFKYALAGVMAVVILLFSLPATEALANGAKPGDWWYPIDRMFEKARVFLARRPKVRREIRQELVKERLEELVEIDKDEAGGAELTENRKRAVKEVERAVETVKKELPEIKEKYKEYRKDGLSSSEAAELKKETVKLIKKTGVRPAVIKRKLKQSRIGEENPAKEF